MDGRRLRFGVSGLLYKRNLLLFDRETDSLWSQLLGKAVTGNLAGQPLRLLPSLLTTWAAWKQQHPGTEVLSFRTGHQRDYRQDPYEDAPLNRSPALVVTLDGQTKLYPFSELKKHASPVQDQIAGHQVMIEFDARTRTARAVTGRGPAPAYVAFVADAKAFYPSAPVFKAK